MLNPKFRAKDIQVVVDFKLLVSISPPDHAASEDTKLSVLKPEFCSGNEGKMNANIPDVDILNGEE